MGSIKQYFPPYLGLERGIVAIVTGDLGVGKTTFGVSAVPRKRLAYIDGEGSGRIFMSQNPPALYIDLMERYKNKYGSGEVDPIKYLEMVNEVFKEVREKAADFDCCVFDNTQRYQHALVDLVEADLKKYKLTPGQNDLMPALKYGPIKKIAESDALDMALACGMFIIVVHLKDVWGPKGPTGVKEHAGYDVYDKISSLTLWLRPTLSGVPAGLIVKDRIAPQIEVKPKGKTAQVDTVPANLPGGVMFALDRKIAEYQTKYGELPAWGETFPMRALPARLPEATWPAIRKYLVEPADWKNPAEGEMPNAEELALMRREMTPEQQELMKLRLAELNAEDREAKQQAKLQDAAVEEARKKLVELAEGAGITAQDLADHLKANRIPRVTYENRERALELAKALCSDGQP